MFGAFILIILFYFLNAFLLSKFKAKLPWLNEQHMQKLYVYHMLFWLIYYLMTSSAPTDSVEYYRMSGQYTNWFDAYTTGTVFIHFVAYPFTNYLFFTYEMQMALFAWFGYWGFVYFYILFKENVRYNHKLFGFELISLFVFLPNMHYWTASLGKGSIIFLGMGMAIYGLSRIATRKVSLIIGLIIVYHVRPHVFLFMAIGIVAGLITGRQNVPYYQKFLVLAGSAAALVFSYETVLSFAGLDADNLVDSFNDLSAHRAFELAKAGSGIDTSNYPLILKLLTFWFRPLFVDSPNIIGIIVSFENLLYLFLTLKLFDRSFLVYMKKAPALIKACAVVFLTTSIALSGTLSNLGIIIRQKSMVMYFLLLLIVCFMDYKVNLRMALREKIRKKTAAPQIQTT
jgi:hypothetical protein